MKADRKVLLLRGVNVGGRRVPMAELRSHLAARGLQDVKTYLQSGNVVLTSELDDEALAELTRAAISEEMNLDVPVVIRNARELNAVVEADPLRAVATEPRFYLTTFLTEPAPEEVLARLQDARGEGERFHASGREIYSWHPGGAGRSKLWAELARIGTRRSDTVTATARNWATVRALQAML